MKGNILVIEDDQDMCDMLAVGLSNRDFTVSTYTSGKEGLAAVSLQSTDVVLADINLPDMNGLNICNAIVTNMPDIPVIIMTAFGSMDTAIAAITDSHCLRHRFSRCALSSGLNQRLLRFSGPLPVSQW